MEHGDSVADDHDLSEAHARWGTPEKRGIVQARDVWRLASRLPWARSLAASALRDPWVCWIAASAVRRHGALQKPLELAGYLRLLKRHRIARAMEIGTLWGGTFYAHCAIAQPDGHMIAMDAFPRENAERMTARFRGLARAGQRVTCIWSDSHAEATRQEVDAALGGAQLDLLFVDGDHSDEGVRRDYDVYAPLVRSGGVIAFHDVAANRADGVPAFWRALRGQHEWVEFVDRLSPPHGLGIGVIVKR